MGGANCTRIVQVAPAPRVVPQFPVTPVVTREKLFDGRPLMVMVGLPTPSFRRVRSSVAVVESTTLPNANGDGDTTRIGVVTADWNSIAPMSNRPPLVSGLAFPEKSRVGCGWLFGM